MPEHHALNMLKSINSTPCKPPVCIWYAYAFAGVLQGQQIQRQAAGAVGPGIWRAGPRAAPSVLSFGLIFNCMDISRRFLSTERYEGYDTLFLGLIEAYQLVWHLGLRPRMPKFVKKLTRRYFSISPLQQSAITYSYTSLSLVQHRALPALSTT